MDGSERDIAQTVGQGRERGRSRTWSLVGSGRTRRALLACCLVLATSVVAVMAGASALPGTAAAAAGPSCAFGPNAFLGFPILTNVTAGEKITIDCTGMPASTEFLLIQTSLLVAIDPQAKALLTGSVESVPGLLALVSALPEMNALSEAFPESNASGVLDTSYTVPTTQPTDPNATCPPPTEQTNSGLIGCAVAMINLSSFKPVTAGTVVLHYASQGNLFPPDPTVALTPATVAKGATVKVSDAPGATTYWWLATLASLYASLAGQNASSFPVQVRAGGHKIKTDTAVAPATYEDEVFTPPKLSGSFAARGHGKENVTVTLNSSLEGFSFGLSVNGVIRVVRAAR
ncbi:MAG TPA: hypothetical protein VMB72_08795 [Acidimicrobiales bacterium]|nr:hypothetical protein [Acidimicrobiales bacterium]